MRRLRLVRAKTRRQRLAGAAVVVFAGMTSGSAFAQTSQARITGLVDVGFGTPSFVTDLSNSQNICVYVGPVSNKYNFRASGSGTSSAFTMASGAKTLAYEVQWSGTTGQTTGTALTAGVAKSGFISGATASGCAAGPTTSASLIVVLRSAQVSIATAGSYSGTLSITITPE